jgi:hypothetical protein
VTGVYRYAQKVKTIVHGLLIGAALGIHPASATDMTAGLILEQMQPRERFTYVAGMIEGIAYARFRKDSAAAGSKDERGMSCIYDWYYEGGDSVQTTIDAAFRKYADYAPSVVVWALIKKECGE